MSGDGLDTESNTAWISQGFERLVDRARQSPADIHFDVLIVGSGYGGSFAATTFSERQSAGRPLRVAVLERGNEYLPGSFPTGLGELPGHVRLDHNKEGLFDVRLGGDVITVLANGVGGGSLINAGVMRAPVDKVFRQGWPSPLSSLSTWQIYFERAQELLGATVNGVPNTIETHPDGLPKKFKAIRSIAPDGTFHAAPVTVAMRDSRSKGNVRLNKCVRCGDCATGCNFGAKISLDVNLLAQAQQQGAEIFSGVTVINIEKDDSNWIANCVYTNAALRARDSKPLRIRTRRLVLAAGTLGSSEILMRSQGPGLPLSPLLGTRCSTNGDMLITDYATKAAVNTVSDETVQPSARAIGPTITGIVDLREKDGVMIEEMSVPAGLRLAFGEVFATANSLHGIGTNDFSRHTDGFLKDDIYAAPASRIENSALYAVMADDGAAGCIELDGQLSSDRDGLGRIRWNELNKLNVFDTQVKTVSKLTDKTGGRTIPNPFWKLLPKDFNWLLKDQRGPLITVHPLGGCPMGDTGAAGVVDHLGRVFATSDSNAVHDGLIVLDGSIIPTALGTNPALTISAVALRAAETLADAWGFSKRKEITKGGDPLVRPVFRPTDFAAPPAATEVEIIERLVGPVRLEDGGAKDSVVVELTLRFEPTPIARLLPASGGRPVLKVATDQSNSACRSRIRVFPRDKWETLEESWDPPQAKEKKLERMALFSAPLTGTLSVFERQKSCAIARIWRAGTAWLLNRGLRDIYQASVEGNDGGGPLSPLKTGIAAASHAGEIRAFIYDLTIGKADPGATLSLKTDKIVGRKTFTYRRRCNPWRQLMEVEVTEFPGLRVDSERVLNLDQRYLARIGVPLFRITAGRDAVSAIGELAAFFGYFVRLLLGIHAWSFRAPDYDASNRPLNRWPPTELRCLDGTTIKAKVHCLTIDPQKPDLGGESPIEGTVRLTRYPCRGTKNKRPVVMFHGYSAGGTTFAHHAVNPNFASYLRDSGRDVWIADLRTSLGQPTAREPWSFDQIGDKDVRAVLDFVTKEMKVDKVDVVAHCLGAVVFSMAILKGVNSDKVEKAAFTQVGPLVVFSPTNIFRAYALKYLVNFLPDSYSFRPDQTTLADDLWDRLLSSLPYPIEEFDIENPIWPTTKTPWARTRHRMDALYGRAFNLVNMEPAVLPYIDEHFGPMSLKTVSTVLHFVQYSMMTNYKGVNEYISRGLLERFWNFPTLSVHGSDNGLAHVSTVDRMRQVLKDAGRLYEEPFINPGAGHQDALIGTKRLETFKRVTTFLDDPVRRGPEPGETGLRAYPPWIGPVISHEGTALVVRVGAMNSHRPPEAAIMLRVQVDGDEILPADDPRLPWSIKVIMDHMTVYRSRELQDRWDAFEVPPVNEKRGGALLVLLVYAEAAALMAERIDIAARTLARRAEEAPFGFFFADANQRKVFRWTPNRPPAEDKDFSFERFTAIADAVLEALDQDDGELEQDRDLLEGVIPSDLPGSSEIPDPNGTSFALASCQCPSGLFDEPVAFRSFEKIVERIDAKNAMKPRFVLFVGDQVYVDPTAGLYDPKNVDDRYRLPYENWLRQHQVRKVLRNVPSFMLLDDHEIDDNWEPVATPDSNQNHNKMVQGREAFKKYQRGRTGAPETFEFDGFHFFMLDTRTERMHRKVAPSLKTAELVSPGAMARLKEWLSQSPGPKFVMTPSILLPRHRRTVQRDRRLDSSNLSALHSDSWDGYPNTLRDVLAFIAENKIERVVFLSGDEHRSCIAQAELFDLDGKKLTTVHSVHTAAMYAPYPFANALGADFLLSETIDIAGRFRCLVTANLPSTGEGATYLTVRKQGSDWWLNCEFAGGQNLPLPL